MVCLCMASEMPVHLPGFKETLIISAMNPAAKLSIIIAAKNEAHNIQACVASAIWADEVIVLDSASTDATVSLAKEAGASVLETDWPGYGPQQNRGIDAAQFDWIYSLDADERITPELQAEIKQAINKAEFKVFDVPRKSFYVNRFMEHSGWWPDRTRRLFKKGHARFTSHEIHANLATDENVGHLQAHMLHYSFMSMESVLEKINRYSSGVSRDLYAEGKRSSLTKAVVHGLWAFLRTYFLRAGFLDGREGFMLAVSNAEGSYYKYIKLMLLAEQRPEK